MPVTFVPLRADALAARLRDLGIVTAQQLERAKQELASSQERFSAILARQGVLRDAEAGRRLALQLGSLPQPLPFDPIASASSGRIPAALWRGHRVVPLREEDGALLVATDDPLSVFALEFLGGRCGCRLEAVLVPEQDLAPWLTRLGTEPSPAAAPPPAAPRPAAAPKPPAPPRTPAADRPDAAVPAERPRASPEPARAAEGPTGAGAATGTDEPIIRLVDSMLAEAVRMRASDVHIEPGAAQLRVRYRLDGVLHDVNSPPRALHGPVVSRVKIMAGLNIAEKRLPQDGRLQLVVEGRPMDVRISTLPASHGESIVLRLLDRGQPIRGLAEMGLAPEEQARWHELIQRPHGMVLVTGPTGSGKTTTLYGALALLNQPDRKLITVEDPVEYQLVGVNQVAVKTAIGLTFAAGLRSMLRQAPDVIMVGEIRDQETAQVAVQAALTGHLVLSTLHTNDAPSAVTRLIDMGIPPFLVASTVQGVMAQRLVRRICAECRMTDHVTPDERAFLGAPEMPQVIRSTGCERCHGTGYLGRVGLFELMTVDEALRQLIVGRAAASALRTAAVRAGMRGLREDGVLKIREGLTTMAEVLRVVAEGGA
jgi:type II secretory ATPase GspE/PulE/Tfp pilus assembly ATPase PilB-like protein